MWSVDLIGRPRTPDVLPELCSLPPGGADKNTVRGLTELLWPESALAPQRLWPDLGADEGGADGDGPAGPPGSLAGEELSASPPRSPTSPNYSPFPVELAQTDPYVIDPGVFDALQLD